MQYKCVFFYMFNTLQSQIICKLLLAYPSWGSKLLQILYENAYRTKTSASITSCPGSTHLTKTMSNLNKIRFAFHLLQTVENCSKHCKLRWFGSVLAVSKAGGGSWEGRPYIYIYICVYITTKYCSPAGPTFSHHDPAAATHMLAWWPPTLDKHSKHHCFVTCIHMYIYIYIYPYTKHTCQTQTHYSSKHSA